VAIIEFTTSFLIALGLALDAFTVSIGVSTSGRMPKLRSKVRLAGHFGIFQCGMTLLGWLVGETIVDWVAQFDHWLAFILLCYVGAQMIRSGLSTEAKEVRVDPSKGWSLVILSVATSLDALAVGLSFAMLGQAIWFPALLIGLVAFGLSGFGLFAGHRLGQVLGKRMEVVGGMVLIGIGVRILITHMF